jgi:hypothetical protein
MLKVALIIFGMISFHGYAQSTVADGREEIGRLMEAQQQSWNSGDLEGFMAYYYQSDSLLFLTPRGLSTGWQQMLTRYQKSYPGKQEMGSLSFDQLVFRELSDINYLVIGRWMLEKEESEEVSGYFSLVWKKKNFPRAGAL